MSTSKAVARQIPVEGPIRTVERGPVQRDPLLAEAIVKHPSPIVQHIVKHRDSIEPLLPEGVHFTRVVYEVIAALAKDAQQKTPALVHCTPDSVFIAVVKIQNWGLEIGQTAHLVPFKTQCEALRDYKGDIELAKRARAIHDADAHCVYENELADFEYEQGMHPRLVHRPIIDPKKRGRLVGVYAIIQLTRYRSRPLYMSIEEVDAIRQKHSKQWKEIAMPPWYMKKTVLRQALKTCPKNPALAKVIAQLDEEAMEIAGGAVDDDAPVATLVRDDDGVPRPVDTSTGEIVGANLSTTPPAEPATPSMPSIPSSDTEEGTLAWALAFPLPWRNSDQYGKPLGGMSKGHVESIAAWCEKKAREAHEAGRDPTPINVKLYAATQLVLEHFAKSQTSLALDDESDIPNLSAPAPGSPSHVMPPPGKVEDAFRDELGLNDRQPTPNRNAQLD